MANLTDNRSTERNTTSRNSNPKVVKRDLTLVTDSDAITCLEPKFLGKNVRIKSFKNATIQNLRETLPKMGRSRYLQLILHIGGQDVDANMGKADFQESYQAIIKFLVQKGCKVFESGLLPRRGTDMKPYNAVLKTICKTNKVGFIDNHDSFVLALGEIPNYFYHADMTNLRFPGIRKVVHNINIACAIHPSKGQHSFQGQNPSDKRSRSFVHRRGMGW